VSYDVDVGELSTPEYIAKWGKYPTTQGCSYRSSDVMMFPLVLVVQCASWVECFCLQLASKPLLLMIASMACLDHPHLHKSMCRNNQGSHSNPGVSHPVFDKIQFGLDRTVQGTASAVALNTLHSIAP
jgi:hypothetical protein